MSDSIELRIPSPADAERAAYLFNAFFRYCTGEEHHTAESMLSEWGRPRFSLEQDARAAVNSEGRWVGYTAVLNAESPYCENIIVFRIDPEYCGRGVGTLLSDWAEGKAIENINKAPEGSRVVVRASNYIALETASEFLHRRGYSLTRYYFRMKQELGSPKDPTALPAGVAIETFDERRELKELIDCTEDVFLDHWGWWRMPDNELWEDWNHNIDTNPFYDPKLWFLARHDDALIGFCLVDSGMQGSPDTGYVDMIGVRKEFRKKGLASYLLQRAKNELAHRHKKAVMIHVDGSSLTGATRIYEKSGLAVDQTRMMFEKVLRDGKDYRSQP